MIYKKRRYYRHRQVDIAIEYMHAILIDRGHYVLLYSYYNIDHFNFELIYLCLLFLLVFQFHYKQLYYN